MRTFPVAKFLAYMREFQAMVSGTSAIGFYDADSIAALREYGMEAEGFSLFSTADQFRRVANRMEATAPAAEVRRLVEELLNRLEDDCRRHVMVIVEPDHLKYIEDAQFFDSADGQKVSAQFPSAGEDIAESGKCLALGRSTACVMHLSRVLEVGLQALAGALGVTKQNDWGRYLTGIDTELEKRMKASGARSPDEQFYAEVHVTFDALRRAWRNPTMHVDKTYTVERAEEILISVRSFMRHLATKLHE